MAEARRVQRLYELVIRPYNPDGLPRLRPFVRLVWAHNAREAYERGEEIINSLGSAEVRVKGHIGIREVESGSDAA